eukprot:m.103711 g.103711  ORF g.103711 m.103711 type:complete len:182 (-) comp15054_c0_seq2:78-623(-)
MQICKMTCARNKLRCICICRKTLILQVKNHCDFVVLGVPGFSVTGSAAAAHLHSDSATDRNQYLSLNDACETTVMLSGSFSCAQGCYASFDLLISDSNHDANVYLEVAARSTAGATIISGTSQRFAASSFLDDAHVAGIWRRVVLPLIPQDFNQLTFQIKSATGESCSATFSLDDILISQA